MKYIPHMALAAATIAAVTPARHEVRFPGATAVGAHAIAKKDTIHYSVVGSAVARDTLASVADTLKATLQALDSDLYTPGNFPKIIHGFICVSPKDHKEYPGVTSITLNDYNRPIATQWLKTRDSLTVLENQCRLMRVDTVKSK